MNYGIKMSDCRFYVNKEERIVICVIPDTEYLLYNFINDNFRFHDIHLNFTTTSFEYKHLRLPKSFMGKAVCAPEDEWDEETGKLIAFSRAKDKCYKSFFKRANSYIQTIDRRLSDAIETFNNFGIKLENKRETLKTKIEERIEK